MAIASTFPLILTPLQPQWMDHAIQIDRACFNGLWTEQGYQREIDSPNSELLILGTALAPCVQDGAESSSVLLESSARPESSARAELSEGIGLGCVWFIVDEAHITLLGVTPQYRQRKLGLLILLTLLEKSVQRGAKWATLEVKESNTAAQALYAKVGFQSVGRRKRYYQDTGEDALILWHRGLQEAKFQTMVHHLKHTVSEHVKTAGFHLHGDER